MKYTVLLLRPESIAEFIEDTYLAHVEILPREGRTPSQEVVDAIRIAQAEAATADSERLDKPAYGRDYWPLLTVGGWVVDITPKDWR